ncbi:MAG TPA: DNA gyrase inhibitor YacG [Methylovirgula sp.]
MSQFAERETKTRGCPICGKAAIADAWPFCSKRCADVDLHHWLAGSYAIPAAAEAEPEIVPDDEGSADAPQKN